MSTDPAVAARNDLIVDHDGLDRDVTRLAAVRVARDLECWLAAWMVSRCDSTGCLCPKAVHLAINRHDGTGAGC